MTEMKHMNIEFLSVQTSTYKHAAHTHTEDSLQLYKFKWNMITNKIVKIYFNLEQATFIPLHHLLKN